MHEETRKWIVKADKDLGTASCALDSVDGPLPVTTALHCQQSAEKYLKAYLQENEVSFSDYQHLIALFELCLSVDRSFETLGMDINQLESYSIASRYPKIEDSLEFRKEAIATTNRVKEFTLGKLG